MVTQLEGDSTQVCVPTDHDLNHPCLLQMGTGAYDPWQETHGGIAPSELLQQSKSPRPWSLLRYIPYTGQPGQGLPCLHVSL